MLYFEVLLKIESSVVPILLITTATPTLVPSEDVSWLQCSNEAASGAKNQEQEQAGSGAEASAGSQDLLIRPLSGASV